MVIIEIFKLFGSVFLKDDDVNKKLDGIDKKGAGVGATLGKMGGFALKAGAAIGAGALAGGVALVGMATKASEAAAEIDDIAQRTNLSAKTLQEFKYAAEMSGFGIDTLEVSAKKLTMTLGKAGDGNKAAEEAFKALGVSITDANGGLKSTDEIFPLVMAKLADMPNVTERNALAMQIFGKSAMDMAPLLNGGSAGIKALTDEANKMGLVMGNDAVEAGAKFDDTLTLLKSSFSAVVTKVGIEVMPIVQKFMDWVIANMPTIQAVMKTVFDVIKLLVTEAFDKFNKYLLPVLVKLWEWIQPNIPKIQEIFQKAFSVITEKVIPAVSDVLLNLAQYVFPIVEDIFNYVVENVIPPLIDIFTFIYKEVVPLLAKKFQEFMPKIADVMQTLFNELKPVLDAIVKAFQIAWPYIQIVVKTAIDIIGNVISGLLTVIKGIIQFVTGVFTGDWKKAWEGVKNIFGGIIDAIVGYVKGYITIFTSIGGDIVRGLWKGISDIKKWIIDKVEGFVSSIGSTIKDFFGISSPSKLTAGYGKNIAEGLAKGIQDNAYKAADAASKLSQNAISALNKLGDATMTALKNKYSKEESLMLKSLGKQTELLRFEVDKRIKIYDDEYNAKLKTINAEASIELATLQAQIDNINRQTEEEEKGQKEQEYNAKVAAKREQILNATNAEEKLSLQKELDAMLAEHQRQVVLEQRQQQIENIRIEMEHIENAAVQKGEALKKEYETKKTAEQLMFDAKVTALEKEQNAVKEHFESLMSEENLQAEARKLALDENNAELITLLEEYNPKWNTAGKSFGESLLSGLNEIKPSIESTVNEILSLVNSAQEAQNKVIIQAKQLYSAASTVGNAEIMNTAHQIAEAARAAGGTIKATDPLPSLDVGTNYIPEDTLAYLHKGEAVIPKAYNPNAGGTNKPSIVVNINNPTLYNDRDADRLGDLLVSRLRVLGVTP